VVTLLDPELLDPVDPVEAEEPLDPEDPVEPLAVEAEAPLDPVDPADPLAAVAVVDAFFAASAGSCPETRTMAIVSHAAMNNATAPATTLRRIARTRAKRACRSARPRPKSALPAVISCS
jgi:hypothetical protein